MRYFVAALAFTACIVACRGQDWTDDREGETCAVYKEAAERNNAAVCGKDFYTDVQLLLVTNPETVDCPWRLDTCESICCVAPAICDDFDCERHGADSGKTMSHTHKYWQETGRSTLCKDPRHCTVDECCYKEVTCASFTGCHIEDYKLIENPGDETCFAEECTYSECCEEFPPDGTCTHHHCPTGYSVKPNRASLKCQQTECDTDECCDKDESCHGKWSSDSSGNYGDEICEDAGLQIMDDHKWCAVKNGGCTTDKCCREPKLCKDFTCPDHMLHHGDGSVKCEYEKCDEYECCNDKPSCSDVSVSFCEGTTIEIYPYPDDHCKGEVCSQEECCFQPQNCGAFKCPAEMNLVSDASEIFCETTDGCDEYYCCVDKPTCADFSCPLPWYQDESKDWNDLCQAPTGCKTSDCCLAPSATMSCHTVCVVEYPRDEALQKSCEDFCSKSYAGTLDCKSINDSQGVGAYAGCAGGAPFNSPVTGTDNFANCKSFCFDMFGGGERAHHCYNNCKNVFKYPDAAHESCDRTTCRGEEDTNACVAGCTFAHAIGIAREHPKGGV